LISANVSPNVSEIQLAQPLMKAVG